VFALPPRFKRPWRRFSSKLRGGSNTEPVRKPRPRLAALAVISPSHSMKVIPLFPSTTCILGPHSTSVYPLIPPFRPRFDRGFASAPTFMPLGFFPGGPPPPFLIPCVRCRWLRESQRPPSLSPSSFAKSGIKSRRLIDESFFIPPRNPKSQDTNFFPRRDQPVELSRILEESYCPSFIPNQTIF